MGTWKSQNCWLWIKRSFVHVSVYQVSSIVKYHWTNWYNRLFKSLSLHIIVLQMLSWRRNNWLFCRSPSIPVSALLSQSLTALIPPWNYYHFILISEIFLYILEVSSSNYCCRQKGSLTDNNIGQVFSGVTHNSTRWEHEKAKIVDFESNVHLFMYLFIKCHLLSNTIEQIGIIGFLRVYLFTLLYCKCWVGGEIIGYFAEAHQFQ